MAPKMEERKSGFTLTLAVSLFIAAATFAAPLSDKDLFAESGTKIFVVLLMPPLFWGVSVLVGLARYRIRGLWLLIGAPLALFWLALLTVAFLSGDSV
jgi:hypothetical protein